MNRIQQEAIAKALGMSASELGDSLYKQELINKVAGDQINKLKEEAKILKASNNARDVAKGLAKEQQAIDLQNAIMSGQTLEQAQRSLTAQQKFTASLEQVQEIFSDLVTGGTLDKLADIIKSFADTLSSGGSLYELFGESDLTKNVRKQRTTSSLKTISELESKDKTSLSEAEIAKLQEAKNYIKEQNLRTQKIDDEYNKLTRETAAVDVGTKFADGGIVTKPITNATVGEAGPEAIIPLSALMSEFKEMRALLSQLVNKEGVVYLDSNKVGTAMAMGTYKTQ
jgi:hypothetical protein